MKKLTKWTIIILTTLAVIFVSVVMFIEGQSSRSQSELKDLVKKCSELERFSEIEKLLGKPNQVIEDHEQINLWICSQTDHEYNGLPGSSKLCLYSHEGPPYRWLYLIIDNNSDKILRCNWTHM